jgi:polar amino acid transport system substrate-binding protein
MFLLKIELIFSFTIFFTLLSNQLVSETIKVGGYIFPPFLEKNSSGFHGITIDLIEEMNEIQDKYIFEFFETSSKRRYSHFENGNYDLIMFEDSNWGWQSINLYATGVFLSGGEVYIAKKETERDQSYFDDLTNKSITVILGYHYGFARFIADESYLRENFNIQFSRNHETNIIKVLEGRSDVSVVTKSFLNLFFNGNPTLKDQLLISDKLDQIYNHRILLSRNSTITIDEINDLLSVMDKAGILSRIWKKYGIE